MISWVTSDSGSRKPCTRLPLVRLVLFPEEIWGGEPSTGHFVRPVTSVSLVPAAVNLDLWEPGLGCLSQNGTACLHSERTLKGV